MTSVLADDFGVRDSMVGIGLSRLETDSSDPGGGLGYSHPQGRRRGGRGRHDDDWSGELFGARLNEG